MKSEVKTNPKFGRLCRVLDLPRAHVAGLLEFLWQTGYDQANDVIGDAVDVEAACEWTGAKGALTRTLADEKWIDRVGKERFRIHDFWDHVPQYVERKRDRKHAKSETTVTRSRRRKVTSQRLVGGKPLTSISNPTQPNPIQSAHGAVASHGKTSASDSLPGFDGFWGAWPAHHRKKDRAKCEAKWRAANLDDRADAVIAVVEASKRSFDWTKQDGQFVPAPLAWLNQGSYDAPAPPPPAKPVVVADPDNPFGIVDPTPEEADRLMREAYADER